MSTGENINANGAVLTVNMIRGGFQKFPQTVMVYVSPDVWPQIAPIEIAAGYPFAAMEQANVPAGELWYVGTNQQLLGRIINIGAPIPLPPTQ